MTGYDPESVSNELPTLSSGLLNRLRDMNPDGWSRLVEVFGPIVYRWCRQAGVSEHDAADVVQEVFISVARGIPRFERTQATGSFRSWLATIARNRVRDHYRRSDRQPVAFGGSDAMAQWHVVPDAPPDETETSSSNDLKPGQVTRRVMELIRAEFEDRTWQAFWLTTVDGQPAAEVAEALQMSLASVYQSKSRVLRRLRQRLAELPE